MQLYESLVKNVGLGIAKIAPDIIAKKLVSGHTGNKFIEDFIKDNDMKVLYKADEWLPSFVTSFGMEGYADRTPFADTYPNYSCALYQYMRYTSDMNGRDESHHIHQVGLIEIRSIDLCIIADVPELKNIYKYLDKVFNKHERWSDYHISVSENDPFDYFVYEWKNLEKNILKESLVSNIGIGMGKANTDYIKELFSTGIKSPFKRFLNYIGAIDTDWICSYMKKESESEFVFTFNNYRNHFDSYEFDGIMHGLYYRPVIYKGKPRGMINPIRSTANIVVAEINEKAFCILDRVPELKDAYRKLDSLFKKYDTAQWEWELNYGNLPFRIYYWKDSKFSFEEVTKYLP